MFRVGSQRSSRRNQLLRSAKKTESKRVMHRWRIHWHRTCYWDSYLQWSSETSCSRLWCNQYRPIWSWNQEATNPNADCLDSSQWNRLLGISSRTFRTTRVWNRNFCRAKTNSCGSITMERQHCTIRINRPLWFWREKFATTKRLPLWTASTGSWWRAATRHSIWAENRLNKCWSESPTATRNSLLGPSRKNQPNWNTKSVPRMPFR